MTCTHLASADEATPQSTDGCQDCLADGSTDWVHLRTSNTEPIIRIYAESSFETTANNIANRLMQDIKEFI